MNKAKLIPIFMMLLLASCVSSPSSDAPTGLTARDETLRVTPALADSLAHYTLFYGFHNGRALVVKREGNPSVSMSGYIDAEGREVIPCQYKIAGSFRNGYAHVHLDDRSFYIDTDGREVPDSVALASSVPDGLPRFFTKEVGKRTYPYNDNTSPIVVMGLKDADGNILVEPRYTWVFPFSEGLAAVVTGGDDVDYTGPGGTTPEGRLGFIDESGREVIAPQFLDHIAYHTGGNYYGECTRGLFSEGLAPVCIDGLFGFIDTKGKVVIPAKYVFAEPFHDGRAMVMKDEKCGFIDHEGHEVIPLKYTRAEFFIDSIAPVQVGDCLGFIDTEGREVIPPLFDAAFGVDWMWYWITGEMYSQGLLLLKYKGKLGFADRNGNSTFRSLDYRMPEKQAQVTRIHDPRLSELHGKNSK